MTTVTPRSDASGTPTAADPTQQSPADPAPDRRRMIGAVAGLVVLLAGMLALFAWPAARSAPRDLPIGVGGPAPAVAQVGGALAAAQPGAFAVSAYPDRAAALAAIEHRDVYGAIVVGQQGAEVLTASAASPAVAQLLGQLGTALAAKQGAGVTITDVVALPAKDPHGAGLGAGLLPIVLGGIASAAALTALVRRRWLRVAGATAFSVLGGLALAAVLQFWIGSLAGSYLANSAVLMLAIAAVSLTVLGLESLLGAPGIGVGALIMMLFGNALSGAMSAPEMLPTGWGAVGQWLPPGATSRLLRSVAFFDGNGAAGSLLVLIGWVLFGSLLLGIAARRSTATTERALPAQ